MILRTAALSLLCLAAAPAPPPALPGGIALRLPVPGACISSPFGPRRAVGPHAALFHNGVDLPAPAGTWVGAAAAGQVVAVRRLGLLRPGSRHRPWAGRTGFPHPLRPSRQRRPRHRRRRRPGRRRRAHRPDRAQRHHLRHPSAFRVCTWTASRSIRRRTCTQIVAERNLYAWFMAAMHATRQPCANVTRLPALVIPALAACWRRLPPWRRRTVRT